MKEYQIQGPDEDRQNTLSFLAGGGEMLRISPQGFWVRGVEVPQGPGEAQAVYNAFRELLTWSQLTRP